MELVRNVFETPTVWRLATVLSEVQSGDLVVPSFPYDDRHWYVEQYLKLLDSIGAGLPVGNLTVWRTSNRDLHPFSGLQNAVLPNPSGAVQHTYVVDGRQRVATLFGALIPGGQPKGDPGDPWASDWYVYVDLCSKGRPQFYTQPRDETVPPHWLPLHWLFAEAKLYVFLERLKRLGMREEVRNAERLRNIFHDYPVPVTSLVTDDVGVVKDVHRRLNGLPDR